MIILKMAFAYESLEITRHCLHHERNLALRKILKIVNMLKSQIITSLSVDFSVELAYRLSYFSVAYLKYQLTGKSNLI